MQVVSGGSEHGEDLANAGAEKVMKSRECIGVIEGLYKAQGYSTNNGPPYDEETMEKNMRNGLIRLQAYLYEAASP